LGDHFRLLDDFFNRKLADDAAKVAFHYQADQSFALCGTFREELLGSGLNRFRIGLYLDLRNGLYCYCDTLARIEILLRRNVERHQLERKAAARLDHRENHRSMTFDDARAAKAIHDKRLMRSRLPVQFCEYRHQEQNGQDHQSCDDQYTL